MEQTSHNAPSSVHDFNVNFNIGAPTLGLLQTLIGLQTSFAKDIHHMSQEIDDLKAAVAANTTTVESAVTLINGIADRITAAGTDPAMLAALTSELAAEDASLAAAVSANVVPDPVPVDPTTPTGPTGP